MQKAKKISGDAEMGSNMASPDIFSCECIYKGRTQKEVDGGRICGTMTSLNIFLGKFIYKCSRTKIYT